MSGGYSLVAGRRARFTVQRQHVVGDRGELEVMCDQDCGAVGGGLGEAAEEAAAAARVESCGRLVQDQDGCVAQDGAGDGDPLPLAAR